MDEKAPTGCQSFMEQTGSAERRGQRLLLRSLDKESQYFLNTMVHDVAQMVMWQMT